MGIRLWNIHARLKEKKKGNNPNVSVIPRKKKKKIKGRLFK